VQLAACERWAKTWYEQMVPRKDWFRDVYNSRQHYVRSDLYDFNTKTYQVLKVMEKDREFFGIIDYLHIFDFGQSDTYGGAGDYSHYSDNPQRLVPTLNRLINANAFPMENDTVWTLFNGHYRTYRAPALEVEHMV